MEKTFIINGIPVFAKLLDHDKSYRKNYKHTGHCFKVENSLVGFFKYNDRLYCFVDDTVGPKEQFHFQNRIEKENRFFSIELNGQQILKTEYPRKKNFDLNPFWPTDEEDVDPALWSSLILNSAERISIILETTNESMAQQDAPSNGG